MSTRSIVGKFTNAERTEWQGRYCHFDGYPDGLGLTIVENWLTRMDGDANRVADFLLSNHWRALTEKDFTIDPGQQNASSLSAAEINTLYFDPFTHESEVGASWTEYAYLFDVPNNALHIFDIPDSELILIGIMTHDGWALDADYGIFYAEHYGQPFASMDGAQKFINYYATPNLPEPTMPKADLPLYPQAIADLTNMTVPELIYLIRKAAETLELKVDVASPQNP